MSGAPVSGAPFGSGTTSRSSIRDLADGTPDAVIVRSAVDLGQNVGLSVVGEGVEDLQTPRYLRAMACDYAQGYALSVPVPADQLEQACRRARKAALAAITMPDPSFASPLPTAAHAEPLSGRGDIR